MAIEVFIHPLAVKEARAAHGWYATRSDEAAERFREAVLEAMQRIANQIAVHPMGDTGFHYARLRHFPYRLVYQMESESTAQVLAISHLHRRPSYWRRRSG